MYEFRLPDLGEGVAEGEVVRWLVKAGQDVREDQPLVEVMTDKATVEIPSPVAGRVASLEVPEGGVVPVGTVLVVIATGERASLAPAVRRESPRGAFALPSVRRLARDLNVDISTITPTGGGSRVTADDVRAAASGEGHEARADEAGIALTGFRRVIARKMEEAARIPAVTVVEECDVTEIEETRSAAGRALSYLSFVLKACARALRDHPDLNATFVDGRLRRHGNVDIGVAVHTESGLVVPVLRRADERTLGQIDDEVARLAERAREGRLSPSDLTGGGFTVSSPGALGGIMATPMINVPQVGILGVHRVAARPAVRSDQIVIRTMCNLSLTFDHRVIDGVPAGQFLHDVVRTLEHPGLLVL